MSSLRLPSRVLLPAILVLAAALRFGVLLLRAGHERRFLEADSASYLALSKNLGAFTSTSNPHFAQSVVRTPVYPLYLFASHAITESRVLGPMILQVLVGIGVVFVTYRLGLSLFSREVGLSAAAILAIDPLSIEYSSLVLTEALFAFFLTAAMVLLWRPHGNTWQRGLAAGLLLGLATLTRPVSLYVSIVVAVGYLALEWKHARRAAPVVVCFLAGFGVLAGGWIVRNYETTGVATASSIEGYNLLYYRAAGALQESEHISLPDARRELTQQLRLKLPPHANPGQQGKAEQSLGLSVIRKHLGGYLKETVAGAGRLVFGDSRSQFPTPGSGVTRLLTVYHLAYMGCLYLLVALGLWSAWRERRLRALVLPVVTVVYTVAISSGLEAYSRFRTPAMPFFALIAAVGTVALVARRHGAGDTEPARRVRAPRSAELS